MVSDTKVLLTPGPLTTSTQVKQSMLVDMGTRDQDYYDLVQETRNMLLQIAQADERYYTAVLIPGSGTYGVESVLTGVVKKNEKVLILSNGAYGERMGQICQKSGILYELVRYSMIHQLDVKEIEKQIARDDITHVAYVHSETTAGVLNDIAAIQKVIHRYHKISIVDAMSSFGAVEMAVDELQIDYLIASSNKCLHGVPGLAFVIANRHHLNQCADIARSLSLDLYAQYRFMEDNPGAFRFTSPTHVLRALHCALKEMIAMGGVAARHRRYVKLQRQFREAMVEQGFQTLVQAADQGMVITTFLYPDGFDFAAFYEYFKSNGFLLYRGKLSDYDAFRIGNIGAIRDEDVARFITLLQAYGKGADER